MEEKILQEVEALREDVNILAQYTKENLDTVKDLIKSIDTDLKSLEQDVIKKVEKISNNSSSSRSDVTYIKQLISDDFKEMQNNLITQVTDIINKGRK
jgi:uncharacterized protein YoxC